MKLLIDFFPIILFFIAFKLADIFLAPTGTLVANFLPVVSFPWVLALLLPWGCGVVLLVTIFPAWSLLVP